MRILLAVALLLQAAAAAEPVTRLAFGSCNRHDLPQPLWDPILAWKPQVWIWLGDNVYGDTEDIALLRSKYAAQKSHPGYARLRRQATILGTWDDHDYGVNDGGRAYPQRAASQRALLDFLDEPALSERRRRPGVYVSRTFGPPGRRADMLGAAQWRWLERTLRASDAQVHLLCSGSQILPTEQRHEKWADYPRSRARLLRLLAEIRPPGLVLVSGDRHFGEISRVRLAGRPLWEITSSGLTHFYATFPGEVNTRRVGPVVVALNYGTVAIDWSRRTFTLAVRGANGRAVVQQTVALDPRRPGDGRAATSPNKR